MNSTNRNANRDTVHMIIDFFILMIIVGITMLIWGGRLSGEEFRNFCILIFIHSIIYFLEMSLENIYDTTLIYYNDRIIRRVTKSFLVAMVSMLVVYHFIDNGRTKTFAVLTFLLIDYIISVIAVLSYQQLSDKCIRRRNLPRTIYVGSRDSYQRFRYYMGKTNMLHNDIGYVCFEEMEDDFGYIGYAKELDKIIRHYNIDQVYFIHRRDSDMKELQGYMDLCIAMGIPCKMIVDIYKRRRASSYVSAMGTYPVVTYYTASIVQHFAVVKRIEDVLISIFVILLTSPLMLLTAICIKLDSKGPILFKQVRVGKNGRHFKIWKFRSMYIDAEKRKAELMAQNEMDGCMFKMKDDPRITRVGKFIRKWSIDELPQFFNVLFGSMSVVGTRPPTVDEVEQYRNDQFRRISIKPGITGMWQVNGRSKIKSFDEVVKLDLEYVDNWSFGLDVKIFFKTFVVLMQHDDAF